MRRVIQTSSRLLDCHTLAYPSQWQPFSAKPGDGSLPVCSQLSEDWLGTVVGQPLVLNSFLTVWDFAKKSPFDITGRSKHNASLGGQRTDQCVFAQKTPKTTTSCVVLLRIIPFVCACYESDSWVILLIQVLSLRLWKYHNHSQGWWSVNR